MDIKLNYSPKQAQKEFHSSDIKFRLYSGAVRAGKSLAGSVESIKLSMLYENNVGIIARKDYTSLRDSTMQTFFQVCPPELISNYNKTEHTVDFVNGSRIYFKDLKEPDKIKSMEVGWFWIDEATECKKDSFEILQSRLSLASVPNHYGFLTTNPDSLTNWVYDFFYEQPSFEKKTIETNTYQMRDVLPEGYIESLERNLSTENVKRLLEGKWGIFEGIIYKDFNYSKNVYKIQPVLNKVKRYIVGVDWGYEHYCSMILIAVVQDLFTNKEIYYVLDVISEKLQLLDYWKEKALYWQKKYNNIIFYCDSARPDNIQEFKNYGINAHNANKEVSSGINSVASLLKTEQLYIGHNHTMLLKEIQGYKFKPGTEEPVKENDDNCDALRYGIHTDKMNNGGSISNVRFGRR